MFVIKFVAIPAVFLILTLNAAVGKELKCRFGRSTMFGLWPLFKYCKVYRADLSAKSNPEEITFSGSQQQKENATVVWLRHGVNAIDFIPFEIVDEFPNLNGISIENSNMPLVRNHIFTSEFKNIQYLDLFKNNIEDIEADAFWHLTELKWIAIWENEVEYLKHDIFRNNNKLEYVNFLLNKIKAINPKILQTLDYINYVNLQGNQCIDRNFCERCTNELSELSTELSVCYSNCMMDLECAALVVAD